MTAELVTGFAGQNHITSDQVGAAMAGIVGTGAYVMAVGGRCAVSMTAANTCHMADGYVVIGGRVVKISATDLSIATGGQSVKRHDLVCVEYDKNPSTGVETASLVVVKGTAGTTAADPSYIAGDILAGASTAQFPLARVSLDGLTPTVELVADVLSPTKTLQDSASQTVLYDGSSNSDISGLANLDAFSELEFFVANSNDVNPQAMTSVKVFRTGTTWVTGKYVASGSCSLYNGGCETHDWCIKAPSATSLHIDGWMWSGSSLSIGNNYCYVKRVIGYSG